MGSSGDTSGIRKAKRDMGEMRRKPSQISGREYAPKVHF